MNLVPIVVDKENEGERSYDIFSKLLNNRIIFITGEIDDNLSNSVIAQLLHLDSINHDDISIYINLLYYYLYNKVILFPVFFIKPSSFKHFSSLIIALLSTLR